MIVVMTHPRPGVSYLAGTLASIDESATGRRVIVSDSDEPIAVPRGWELDTFVRPITQIPDNRWSLWRAFILAVEAGQDLVVCEDDVRWCRSGARYAERLTVPADVNWVTLFDTAFRAGAPHGLWRARAPVFAYAQAIKFSLRTCRLMRAAGCLAYDRAGSDNQLAAIGALFGLTYAVHVPSLVQHVGDVSAVGNGGLEGRTSETWRADYDPELEHNGAFV